MQQFMCFNIKALKTTSAWFNIRRVSVEGLVDNGRLGRRFQLVYRGSCGSSYFNQQHMSQPMLLHSCFTAYSRSPLGFPDADAT